MIIKIEQNTETPRLMTLLEDVYIFLPNNQKTDIKAGFTWDGNTTPGITKAVLPPHVYKLASLVHDYYCRTSKNNNDRLLADKDYKWILENIYHLKFKGMFGYFGVTMGRWWWRLIGHYK